MEGQDNREHVKGGSGRNIVISGGTVNAFGKKYSAGIGSGCYDKDGLTTADTITISNATVRTFGGENGSGIGGGDKVAGKNITITNADVEATGGSNGSGIGGGSNGAGDTIKVENSVVVATRGENNTTEEGTLAAGIGGGFATQGTERIDSGIQIIGGSVWCKGEIRQEIDLKDVEPKEVRNAKGEIVKNIKVNTMEASLLKNVTIEGETTPYATDIDGNIISMYVPERNQIATIVYDADTEHNLTKQYKIFPNPTPTKGDIPLLYSEFRPVEIITKDQYGNKIAGIDVKLLEKYKGYQIDDFSFKTAITDKSQNLIFGIHTIVIDETTIPMGYELPAIKELSFSMQSNGTLAKTPSSAKSSKSDARGTTNKPNAIHRSGKRSYIKKPRKQDNTGVTISPDGKQLIIQLHSKEASNKPVLEVHYTDGWINVDVPVAITAKDSIGISTIKINDQVVKEDPTTPQSLEHTYTVTESGEYTITVVNKDGKIASETITISIDKAPPTGEIKEVDNKKVLVAKDTGGSGIDHIVGEDGTVIYQVQAGEETLNTMEISLEKAQKYTIYDKAGNTVDVTGSTSGTTDDKKEEGSTIPPAVIPTIPNLPTVEDEKKEEIQKENRPSLVLDYEKGWTNKDVPVAITATDENGITHIVMPDGTTRKPDSTSPKKMDTHHTIKENGNYTYTVVNKDGKETSETITVKIDKIAPTVTVKQEDKQHTLYAKDKESGVSYVITPSGKTINWKKEYDTNGLKVTENGVYTVYDKAGNKGTGTVSGIEKKKEEPSIPIPTVPEQSQKKDQNQKNNQEVEHPYHNEITMNYTLDRQKCVKKCLCITFLIEIMIKYFF